MGKLDRYALGPGEPWASTPSVLSAFVKELPRLSSAWESRENSKSTGDKHVEHEIPFLHVRLPNYSAFHFHSLHLRFRIKRFISTLENDRLCFSNKNE